MLFVVEIAMNDAVAVSKVDGILSKYSKSVISSTKRYSSSASINLETLLLNAVQFPDS